MNQIRPQFIQIGDEVLNLAHVQRIRLDGPDLLKVHFIDGVCLPLEDEEAHEFMKALNTFGFLLDRESVPQG